MIIFPLLYSNSSPIQIFPYSKLSKNKPTKKKKLLKPNKKRNERKNVSKTKIRS